MFNNLVHKGNAMGRRVLLKNVNRRFLLSLTIQPPSQKTPIRYADEGYQTKLNYI